LPTLEQVYRDHFDFVYRVARRFGGYDLDPEDLAQEVFVVVARKLHTFDNNARITTWLFGITINVVRSSRRNRSVRLRHRADESEADQVGVETRDPLEVRDAARIADEILQGISEKRRIPFILFELQGMSCAEIAELLDIKEETVWSRLHYARREFTEGLARHHEKTARDTKDKPKP
jgi:RNA polymerase sigma-70 factor (ECF subfamily)